MPELPAALSAAAVPAEAAQTPQSDPAAELAAIREENARLKSNDGRHRNEKGVMTARIRELEALLLDDQGNQAPQAPQAGVGYSPQPAYQPAYGPAPVNAGQFVSRDELDLFRIDQRFGQQPEFLQAIRQIANDGGKVGTFIRYRVDAYGRPVVDGYGRAQADVYGTYEAIARYLELQQLLKQRATPAPAGAAASAAVPAAGFSPLSGASGGGASPTPQVFDLSKPHTPAELEAEMKNQGLLPQGFAMEGGKYRAF